MNIEKLARQIAMKYVYGDHNALTDEQEIQDMTKDITDLVIENEAKNHVVLDNVSKRAFDWGKTLTEEDLVSLTKKYFPKRSEKIAYYIGCRRPDLIKCYRGEHGC